MADESFVLMSGFTDKKTYKLWLNLFWSGLLIYIGSYVLTITTLVNYKFCNLFQILGLLILIPTSFILAKRKIDTVYLRVLFFLYCCWSLSLIFRVKQFDYDSIKHILLYPNYGFIVYVIPLVLLFPRNIIFFKKTFDFIVIFAILYLIYDIFFLKVLLAPYQGYGNSMIVVETFSNHLSLPCGFLLLTYVYHSKKRNMFALFIILLTFLFAVIRARRGMMFMSLSMLTFSYAIYQYANKTKIINIILGLFLIITISFIGYKIYYENRNDTFGYITQRIGEDTRNGVEQDFYRDLKTKDWIIGKGIIGEYYCPGVPQGPGLPPSIFRKVIETGYLQTILNGGIVSLGLFLLIAIPAIFKGLFFSRNILSKASAIWILLTLLFSYPGTPTAFSLFYILVWISIGICYSNEIRSIPDDRIRELFSENKTAL